MLFAEEKQKSNQNQNRGIMKGEENERHMCVLEHVNTHAVHKNTRSKGNNEKCGGFNDSLMRVVNFC